MLPVCRLILALKYYIISSVDTIFKYYISGIIKVKDDAAK